MGFRLWKEVLCRGRQQDRFGRWFTVDGGRIQESFRNANKMLERGVPIPCIWEHQQFEAKDADNPEKKARYAKLTFAHVGGARINDRGNLELRHDCSDPADVKQLRKVRYVSPKLCGAGYEDSRGGKYHGTTIAHVAATPTPVQFWQRPFEFSRDQAFYLSYTPEDAAMAKEDDEGKGGKPKGDEGDGNSELGSVIDALREKGITVPDEVIDWTGLVIAIKASGGSKSDDDLGLDDDDTTATTAAPGAPMLMSEERSKPLRTRDQKTAASRIRSLYKSGRITRDVATKKIREAESFEFSYSKAGDTNPNKLDAWIEAREDLPKHSAWKPKGDATDLELSETRVQDPPTHLTGDAKGSGNSTKEATDFVLGFISDPPKK